MMREFLKMKAWGLKKLTPTAGYLAVTIAAYALLLMVPELVHAQQQQGPRCNGADGCIARGLCNIIFIATGSFGALIMSVAGVVSLISAATGMYRTTVSVLVVGIGTWLLEPMINLFYGYPVCNGWGSTFRALPMGM
jgi:hypothetical protein